MSDDNDLVTIVARGFGYGVTHVVTAPRAMLRRYSWLSREFAGLEKPVAARCGSQIRSCQTTVIVMRSGSRVKCPRCRRITGIEQHPARDAATGVARQASADDRRDER